MMIWNILQALTAFYTLIKGVKYYRKLDQVYQKLKSSPLTNVSEITELFKNKRPSQKLFVILKGVAKTHSKSGQKDILSIITTEQLTLKPLNLNSLSRVGWSNIIQKSKRTWPRSLKKIQFSLKDISGQQVVQISNCQKSNISGSLSEIYSDFVIHPQPKNPIIRFVRGVYRFFFSMFPLNLVFKKLKYGDQIKYFGILDGQFLLAIGEVKKNSQGLLQMKQPYYLTKQKGYIQKKLKTKMNYVYWIILVIGLIKVYALYQIGKYALYQIGKKCIKMFFKQRQSKMDLEQQQKRSQQEADFANCIICYTNIRSVVLKPCRHYGFCSQCYENFKAKGCPLCKNQITGIIKIIKKK